MDFLGNLGININLLIAQIVNFALLLWLLHAFLYKPIVKKIEDDEALLSEAKAKSEKLDADRRAFEAERVKTLADARSGAEKIVSEAEAIAKRASSDAAAKAKGEAKAVLEQSERIVAAQKASISDDVKQGVAVKIAANLKDSFGEMMTGGLKKKFQDAFFADLIGKIGALDAKEIENPQIAAALDRLGGTRRGGAKRSYRKKAEEDSIEREFGPIILEYAQAPSAKQSREIARAVAGKIGFDAAIVQRENQNLVSGFRLEIWGAVVESNILNIIRNAENTNEG